MAVRVSQVAMEALTSGSPPVRVSQALVEVVAGGSPSSRVSQLVIEVVVPVQGGAPPTPLGGCGMLLGVGVCG